MAMTLYSKMQRFYAKNTLKKVGMTLFAFSILWVASFMGEKSLANELTIDIGYQDDIALDVRYRVKHGLFLTSSAHKEVNKAGVGYGYMYEDFFVLASYDSEEIGTIYGSYKPRKAHWQVGLRLEQGKDSERAEIEYTYLFQDSVGAVVKVDSNGDWFLGFRKWL